MRRERGGTAAEILVVATLAGIAAAVALPAASRIRDAGRTEAGARYVATLFAAKRWEGVAGRRSVALHFERDGGGWVFREAEDGNGNGLRTDELRRGVDRYVGAPVRLESRVEGVRVGLLPDRSVPEAPPGNGVLPPDGDPVRFGVSDLVSFSPQGRSSSGTLYVTDGRGGLAAIVLFGPASRARVWRWREEEGRWTR